MNLNIFILDATKQHSFLSNFHFEYPNKKPSFIKEQLLFLIVRLSWLQRRDYTIITILYDRYFTYKAAKTSHLK